MAKISKIGAAIILSLFFLTACGEDALGDRYIGFAQCLTDKQVKMYGAYWCPHCADQKSLFGKKGFEKITYIECDRNGENANPQLCKAKKIEGYPTWEFADKSMNAGEMTLAELSKKTGCLLPALPASEN